MNTALKHWKEAATVIIAAGTRHRLAMDSVSWTVDKGTSVSPVGTGGSGRSNLPLSSAFDYQVLLLKRSGKSGFMPNAYVFPGGLAHGSDFSSEWLDIFKPFTQSPNFGLAKVKQSAETRPPIFATDRLQLGSPIPGEVAFRICAVRETFEECGVLLAVPKTQQDTLLDNIKESDNGHTRPQLAKEVDVCSSELTKWRALVNENPSNFIKMCKELELLPNIWALHEWGNWLTPTGIYAKERRYDTAFFICCMQETPYAVQDEKEITHLKWSAPSEVLHSYQARELWIAPPQFYDLSRMCRLPSLRDLHSFASSRAAGGCEQWLPIRLATDQSYITLLPGDQLYPVDGSKQVDLNQNTDISLDNSTAKHSALHRLVSLDPYTISVQMTITPKYNHLLPFIGPIKGHTPNSQL